MSEYHINSQSVTPPPTVPTSFVTDDGTAIPALNILNVNGIDSTENNSNGIITRATPASGNVLQVVLTNRLAGTGTSTNASVLNLSTLTLGSSAGVYRFQFDISGRDTVSGDGIGYTVFASAKTNGVTGTIISTPFIDNDEDASLVAASADFVASGNTVILQVTGVAGRTINYSSVGSYVVV